MGEYEDRYPESYGRGADVATPSTAPEPIQAQPVTPPRDARLRTRLGLSAAAETAPAWQHAPNEGARAADPVRTIEPTAPPRRFEGTFRGYGPRGYVRSDQRIFEDICDRLTENPFIDASDIEVTVSRGEVILDGSVDSRIALRQAEEIADEAVGVSRVHNRLTLRSAGGHREPTPGDQVNRAMGTVRGR